MEIAVIGYGSLIWDLDDLAPQVTGDWKPGAGPAMPVEFSRVSAKRNRALALVIQPDVPAPSRTSIIASRRNDISSAISDLAKRERTVKSHIGYALANGKSASYCRITEQPVIAWLRETGIDAAVWTDLNSNFHEETGTAFDHESGVAYLQALNPPSLGEAWRYITYAPKETDTPFRRYLAGDAWWQGLPQYHQCEPA